MLIHQIKQELINQGFDIEAIDWQSYPKNRDINIEQWLSNEYGIIIKSDKQVYEECKAAHEALEHKEEPFEISLSAFEEKQSISEPITEEKPKELIIKLDYEAIPYNFTINQKPKRKSRLKNTIMTFIQGIKAKIEEKNRFLDWKDYINKVLIPNVEFETKLEVWR